MENRQLLRPFAVQNAEVLINHDVVIEKRKNRSSLTKTLSIYFYREEH